MQNVLFIQQYFLVDDDNDADDGNNEDIEIRGLTFFLKKTKFFI